MLRKIFGPSRKEIWTQLGSEIGARYVDGGVWKADKVVATHGQWTVTLDTYAVSTGKATVIFTRMRAPYVNPNGFRFTIYRKGFFSETGKTLGMQDIEIGDAAFDEAFIIKGTDESQVRALFADGRLRDVLMKLPKLHLTVKDDEGWFGPDFPEGVDELYFNVAGVIKDVEQLKLLYDLFAQTLDQLCRIGSAYETRPDVTV
jgi:hypothetical protein